MSPGILKLAERAISVHQRSFIYTLSMHLGSEAQNFSLKAGYDQRAEDQLLEAADWQSNGYRLLEVSAVALSSGSGFFSPLAESNCVVLRRADYLRVGGLDEAFQSPGGGLANLDFFARVMSLREVQPIMLLGEATLHQFHGGVTTNVPMEQHPWESFNEEYRRIRGGISTEYQKPSLLWPSSPRTVPPVYLLNRTQRDAGNPVAQHLAHGLASNPKAPYCFAFAQPFDVDTSPYLNV